MNDLPGIVSLLKDVGGYGALILVLLGLRQRWWVPGWVYDESVTECERNMVKLERDRDWWRDRFIALTEAMERAR